MDNSYIKDTLISLGYNNLRDFGTHWRTNSVFRSGNNSTALQIKKDTGEFYDFVLKKGGNFKELILLSKGEVNEEQLKELNNYKEKPIIKTQKIYDKFILNKLVKNYYYWTNKGILEETIKLFDCGVCLSGKMAGRFCFPIFNDKYELVGSSGRWMGEENENICKWKHCFKVSEVIYPIHLNKQEIIDKKEVIVVESIGNLLSLYNAGIKNVLVLFGIKINRILISFLLKYNIQKIILILDNDIENNQVGNNAAEDIKSKLLHYFDENQIVNLTELVQNNDLCNWFEKDGYGFEQFCKDNLTN